MKIRKWEKKLRNETKIKTTSFDFLLFRFYQILYQSPFHTSCSTVCLSVIYYFHFSDQSRPKREWYNHNDDGKEDDGGGDHDNDDRKGDDGVVIIMIVSVMMIKSTLNFIFSRWWSGGSIADRGGCVDVIN
ncbi:hypothetical protein Ahia01_000628400 [Argonauta hians]